MADNAQGAIPFGPNAKVPTAPNLTNVENESDDFADPIGSEHGEEADKVPGATDISGRFGSIGPEQYQRDGYKSGDLFSGSRRKIRD